MRNRLLTALALLLLAAPVCAQPTLAQSTSNATTGIAAGGAAISFSGTPTAGSGRYVLLGVAQTSSNSHANTAFTIADNQSNTYTLRCDADVTQHRVAWYTAPISTASGTFTASLTHTSGDQFGLSNVMMWIGELSGVDTGTPVNQVGSGTTGTSATSADPIANTSAAAFIAGITTQEFGALAQTGSGWTEVEQGSIPAGVLYRAEAAGGDFEPSWTIEFSNTWASCAIALGAAAAGSSAPGGQLTGVGELVEANRRER